MVEPKLILPGNPLFDLTLHSTLPPGWEQEAQPGFAFVVRADGSGILDLVNAHQFDEYVEGGEYDQRLLEMEDANDYE